MTVVSRPKLLVVRALGAVVAALLALGQLASLGHLLLVQHTVCAEHGDMHHGDAVEAPRASQAAGIALEQGSPSSLVEHDHCDGWVRVPQHVAHDSLATAAPALVDAPLAADLGATSAVAAPIALLALAPKLAPPRV